MDDRVVGKGMEKARGEKKAKEEGSIERNLGTNFLLISSLLLVHHSTLGYPN